MPHISVKNTKIWYLIILHNLDNNEKENYKRDMFASKTLQTLAYSSQFKQIGIDNQADITFYTFSALQKNSVHYQMNMNKFLFWRCML